MQSEILLNLGIDPVYLLVLLFLIQIVLFIFLIDVNMKYKRLKVSYFSFMKGKDGKSLEESIFDRFKELDELSKAIEKQNSSINELYKKIRKSYQKIGIIKYDAFEDMEGKISFALTMLDEENNGWILNFMNTRVECHTLVKEIIKGQSYIELTQEEKESLEHAIYQEQYDIRNMDAKFGIENK